MDTMYERCCGLDIHKKTIEACFRSDKKKTHMSFGTTSAELRKLTMWLVENDCQSVAMESTGSYWKPIFNILELSGTDMKIIVVEDNAFTVELLLHAQRVSHENRAFYIRRVRPPAPL